MGFRFCATADNKMNSVLYTTWLSGTCTTIISTYNTVNASLFGLTHIVLYYHRHFACHFKGFTNYCFWPCRDNIVAKYSENKAQKYKCCFLKCSITYSCVLIVLDEIVHAFNGYIFT